MFFDENLHYIDELLGGSTCSIAYFCNWHWYFQLFDIETCLTHKTQLIYSATANAILFIEYELWDTSFPSLAMESKK